MGRRGIGVVAAKPIGTSEGSSEVLKRCASSARCSSALQVVGYHSR